MDVAQLELKLKEHGQEHLLHFWPSLCEEERNRLFNELNDINMAEVIEFFRHTIASANEEEEKSDLQPIPPELHGAITRTSPELLRHYEHLAMEQIGQGRVAALLLAGGQGTRLGVDYPKGMFNVGCPSGKTLYQLQAERLVRLQQLTEQKTGLKGAIPWYIMTSEHTKEPTQDFFRHHNFFGLKDENLVVFEQGMLPCFSLDGKIILETKSHVAKSPDGNGGLYRALRDRGILDDMERRQIQYIHVYCVDNILVKMADPHFIGFCLSKDADCAAKVVEKAFPTEAVGVVCKVHGHYKLNTAKSHCPTAQKRNADGRLTFSAGNICNHFFTTQFLRKVIRIIGIIPLAVYLSSDQEGMLHHHIAKKKISHVDSTGKICKPDKPNGIKMEKFVFDVFQFAKNFVVWEVLREDEFSPLKNSDQSGEKDTPTTARLALYSLHQRQVLAAGGIFVDDEGIRLPLIPSVPTVADSEAISKNETNNNEIQKTCSRREEPLVCEISPLVSYAGEGLEELVKGKKFRPPLLLSSPSEFNGIEN
uniref:UDP-N-acetylglucosamine diphosphorylase n=1 Tax=Daphnia galeata TaxID=27404 RepID=A0A8J2WQM0_9CRUS|nr:unnamed protein product [Daphnia galeata]